jgi:hypothetical protein
MTAMTRWAGVAWVVLLVSGCATSGRLEKYQALSPEAQQAYDKYSQFFTESQRDRYLALPTDGDRRGFIGDLHIEERLAKYPKYIQEAIWSRQVVAGMDKEAVFLTWGQPDEVERATYEEAHGVERETWIFRRGVSNRESYQVLIITGQVIEVRKPVGTK